MHNLLRALALSFSCYAVVASESWVVTAIVLAIAITNIRVDMLE